MVVLNGRHALNSLDISSRDRAGRPILRILFSALAVMVLSGSGARVRLPIEWMAALPVAAILFALGRSLFWRSYHRGAPARALGFGLTIYPTVLLFALLIAQMFLAN